MFRTYKTTHFFNNCFPVTSNSRFCVPESFAVFLGVDVLDPGAEIFPSVSFLMLPLRENGPEFLLEDDLLGSSSSVSF